jgi:hypothetical protein
MHLDNLVPSGDFPVHHSRGIGSLIRLDWKVNV